MTPLAPKLVRRGERAVLRYLLTSLERLERDWADPLRRRRALDAARRLANGAEAAGIRLPPGTGDLARRLAVGPEPHELAALIVPLERALDRSRRDEDLLPATDRSEASAPPMPVVVVADSLRSAWNVGGVFRSCECFGAEQVLLTGYSAGPDDARVARAAMGTDRRVAWSRERSAVDALAVLRARGCLAIALETGARHPTLAELETGFPCAILIGNERFGLAPSVVEAAHARARIPTWGAKESLNVVSALAIALYELRGRFEASRERAAPARALNPRRRADR